MTLWIVSGARRGVGKTHLAQRLAQALPGAVRAKIGHNPPRPDGPGNYFTDVEEFSAFLRGLPAGCEHCVVESNLAALRRAGDVRIYIGAPPGAADVRPDAVALEADAHIAIVPGARPDAWRQALRARIPDDRLADALLGLMADQQGFISRLGPAT